MRALILGAALWGSTGCDLLIASNVLSMVEYDNKAAKGEVPAMGLVHECQRESLVRDKDGKWVQGDYQPTRDCLKAKGWQIGPDGNWAKVQP